MRFSGDAHAGNGENVVIPVFPSAPLRGDDDEVLPPHVVVGLDARPRRRRLARQRSQEPSGLVPLAGRVLTVAQFRDRLALLRAVCRWRTASGTPCPCSSRTPPVP